MNLLRLRADRLDLGFLAGDVLTVQGQGTAEDGQIVVTRAADGAAGLARHDGKAQVIGLVVEMNRRV